MTATATTPSTDSRGVLVACEAMDDLERGLLSQSAWMNARPDAALRDLALMDHTADFDTAERETRALALSINRADQTSDWRAAWVRERMAEPMEWGSPVSAEELRVMHRAEWERRRRETATPPTVTA